MRAVSDRFESPFSGTAFALGAILFIAGAIGIILDVLPEGPMAGWGMQIDLDLELLGIVAITGAVLGERIQHPPSPLPDTHRNSDCHWDVYISRPLLETLLQFARRSEPESLSIGLATTPAGQLSDAEGLSDTIPVFTHLYLPEQPNSVSSVFGMDLHTPVGRTHGRFVSHPFSELQLTKRDDLHAVVFVAVPPWDETTIAAFDRAGRRHSIRVVEATPPDESLPSLNQ